MPGVRGVPQQRFPRAGALSYIYSEGWLTIQSRTPAKDRSSFHNTPRRFTWLQKNET